tara:strand:+ start:436 stop:1140 length:705 start_codon:yes stop_codon:yes gene_type:complete
MIIYIPARSGSKRIKNKNIELLGDFSLLKLAVIRALEIEKYPIVVSSDSDQYLSDLFENNRIIKHLRSNKFAKDETSTAETIINDIKTIWGEEYQNNICIIQATNPFTKIEDIQNACKLYEKDPKGSIVSVIKIPYKNNELFSRDNFTKKEFLNQKGNDNDDLFFVDGNFTITNINFILENHACWKFNNEFSPYYQEMDYSIDIDYPWMLKQARLLWKEWVKDNNQKKFYDKYS